MDKRSSNDVFAYFENLFEKTSEEDSNSRKHVTQSDPASKKERKASEDSREFNFSDKSKKKTTPTLSESSTNNQTPSFGFKAPESQRTTSNEIQNQKMMIEEPKSAKKSVIIPKNLQKSTITKI